MSVRRQVTVDECPNCGSYWLDVGELATVRSELGSEEEGAQKIAQIFRFICPSYYAPGNQEWGAF